MKKYWIKDLTENQVIHAPTKMIAERLSEKFDILGLTWNSGGLYTEYSIWYIYKKETCYLPYKGEFSDLSYSTEHGYEILTIDQLLDFQDEEESFPRWMMVGNNENKLDNKRLVLCKLPGGKKFSYIVVRGDSISAYEKGEDYSIATFRYAKEIDEPVEMTLEQVCKELGREIKIIK